MKSIFSNNFTPTEKQFFIHNLWFLLKNVYRAFQKVLSPQMFLSPQSPNCLQHKGAAILNR